MTSPGPPNELAAHMANCLIALGSNLGNRRQRLDTSVAALASLPNTRLLARSQWHETQPVGGPPDQGAFLNGVVRLDSALPPAELHRRLLHIEQEACRQRRQRWAARTLDLDLLLYGRVRLTTPQLEIPHPRMSFRPFVLQGAVEAAPWMQHPTIGWTLGHLWRHLRRATDVAVIATDEPSWGNRLATELAARLHCTVGISANWQNRRSERPLIAVLPTDDRRLASAKLVLFLHAPHGKRAGRDALSSDRLVSTAPHGPALHLAECDDEEAIGEAVAALSSVWPRLLAD